MTELTTLFNQGWFSSALALISIPLALYLWFRPRRIVKPTMTIKAEHALSWPGSSTLPPGVELAFAGKKVPRLARCVVRFWNAGTEDLEATAIRATDLLRLELHDGEILDVRMLKENKPSNKCAATKDPNNPAAVLLGFDFLGPNDGVVFGILHTSSKARPKVKGELRNCKIRVISETPNFGALRLDMPRLIQKTKVMMWVPLVLGAIAVAFGIKPTIANRLQELVNINLFKPVAQTTPDWALVIVGLMYCVISIMYLWLMRRRYPATLSAPTDGGRKITD